MLEHSQPHFLTQICISIKFCPRLSVESSKSILPVWGEKNVS